MTEIVMPQLGESVTEGTITQWFKSVGDAVTEDEPLFEVSTDKVDSEVPSPASGVVTEIRVPEGDTVDVGTVLVVLGDEGSAPAPAPVDTPAEVPTETAAPVETEAPAAPASAAPAADAGGPATAPPPLLSPVVRRLVEENGIDPAALVGTGVGGRVTREDVLAVVDRAASAGTVAPPAAAPPAPPAAPTASPAPPAAAPATARAPLSDDDVSVPFNNIRRLTGDHMVNSKATSPHAVTIVEVDFEAVERARQPAREQFRAEEGHSLTFLPFISRAVVDAISEFPKMNATVGDGELTVHGAVNLSIAVDLDYDGLLAPVIAGADGKRLRAIARDIDDLATRARTRRLTPDQLDGGTFTLSNSGSYGTAVVIPIINQPQVAILSTDGVSRKPVVIFGADGSESIGIHSVGNLTLAWDHRAFDGAYSAAFMSRVKEILETRDWSSEL